MRSWADRLVADGTSHWWVLLLSGTLWVLLSLAILQFDLTSVRSIAVLTGFVLFLAAGTEFAAASIAPALTWAHVLLGVLFLIGGVIAFAWPAETFVVVARLIGWWLLFLGTFQVIDAMSTRHTELWWLRLIAGAATVGIAFWAVGSLNLSATLLVLLVGLGALFHGVNEIFSAFEYRRGHEAASSRSRS